MSPEALPPHGYHARSRSENGSTESLLRSGVPKLLIFLLFGTPAFGQNPIINDVYGLIPYLSPGTGPSPGSQAEIRGSNFAAGPSSKVSVTVGGKSAYMIGADPSSISAEIPADVPPGPTTLTVAVDGRTSAPFNITLEAYAPGIFSCGGLCNFGSFLNSKGLFASPSDPFNANRLNIIAQFSGTAWLAMPNSMASALNLPGNCIAAKANSSAVCAQPAAPGDYLVLYATGLGKTTPNGDPSGAPLLTGQSPPANGSVLYNSGFLVG